MPRPAEKLLHELRVHQIELEMQNEQLKQSQSELEKSRDRYANFYDFAPVGYITLNREAMIDEINLTGAALLGVERARLANHRFAPFVVTEDRDRWHRHFLNVLTHGDTQVCELALQRGSGSRFYARLDCLCLSNAGTAPEVRIVMTDITERKKTEQILRQHKLVIDTAIDGFWMVDAEGNLLEVNAAYANMSGYSIEELTGMHISRLEAKEQSAEEIKAHVAKVIAQGYDRFETRHRRKNGQEIDVEISATFMPQSRQFFVFCHDISERKQMEKTLQETLRLLEDAQQLSQLGGWKYDCATGLVSWTDEVYRIYGVGKDYDPSDVENDIAFYSPDDAKTIAQAFEKAVKDGVPYDLELQFTRLNGERIWVRTIGKPVFENDKITGVHGNIIDITERKLAEEAVRAQEEFFRMIAENVEDYIAVIDLEGKRLYNSPSYAQIFGSVEAIKGTDSFAEIHPDDLERVKQAFKETVQSGRSHRLNYRFVLADGSIHYMESCGGLIRNSQGQALRVVVVSRDITERIKEVDEIRNMAFYDALTQLPNRRLLHDRLEQAMAASKRSGRHGALLFLDLDNFKPLNDTYGHEMGDILLAEVARRISVCVREMDTVARFGGDEFVVLLSELDTDRSHSTIRCSNVAEKIRAVLAETYVLKFQPEGKEQTAIEHRCTSSIGAVVFFGHETSKENILKWADIAMYQAKEAGRNQIRFYEAKD
ncbi:MAG: PAS domain S-box protein, partial [Gallionella sp.]|nr:PAS domain S-box protein [Gallionella sp.]